MQKFVINISILPECQLINNFEKFLLITFYGIAFELSTRFEAQINARRKTKYYLIFVNVYPLFFAIEAQFPKVLINKSAQVFHINITSSKYLKVLFDNGAMPS